MAKYQEEKRNTMDKSQRTLTSRDETFLEDIEEDVPVETWGAFKGLTETEIENLPDKEFYDRINNHINKIESEQEEEARDYEMLELGGGLDALYSKELIRKRQRRRKRDKKIDEKSLEELRKFLFEEEGVTWNPEQLKHLKTLKSGGKVKKKKSGGKVYTSHNKRYAHGGKVSGRKATYKY